MTYVDRGSEDETFKSTVEEGGYLNNQKLVESFVNGAQLEIPSLTDIGVKLEVREYPWGRGLNRPSKQYLTVSGKQPHGISIIEALRETAEGLGVKILYNSVVTRLLTNGGSVVGATILNLENGRLQVFRSKAVVLATGGGARIFGRTDNPRGTTGDGYALAYRVGAELVDMELMEFMIPNSDLEKIFSPDLSREESEKILSHGGCHYFLGGVKVDEDLGSSIGGLYAAGEVAGGLFGASRLWGSALADAITLGARTGSRTAKWVRTIDVVAAANRDQIEEERVRLGELCVERKTSAASVEGEISKVMWKMCGVLKNSDTMSAANDELERLEDEASRMGVCKESGVGEAIEVVNMLDVAKVIIKAASLRMESRGAFWRLDYKEPSNEDWLASLVVSRRNGAPIVEVVPPIMTKLRVPRDWAPRIGNHVSGHLQV
jgi:succinate dehydrogenase/fumarate reductase flavoprotein subunit